MSETTTPTPADVLAKKIAPKTEEPSTEEKETIDPEATVEPEAAEEESTEEETEETNEEELPEPVKEILKKNRKLLREAEAKNVELQKKLDAAAKPAEEDGEKEPVVDDKYKNLYINTAAKAALTEAGLTSGTDRFLKMIDLSNVEVNDDGEIEGLSNQIEELTEEFADLIQKPVKKAPVKSDAAGRRETPPAPKSSADLLAEKMTGKK